MTSPVRPLKKGTLPFAVACIEEVEDVPCIVHAGEQRRLVEHSGADDLRVAEDQAESDDGSGTVAPDGGRRQTGGSEQRGCVVGLFLHSGGGVALWPRTARIAPAIVREDGELVLQQSGHAGVLLGVALGPGDEEQGRPRPPQFVVELGAVRSDQGRQSLGHVSSFVRARSPSRRLRSLPAPLNDSERRKSNRRPC